jgi:acyl CoA:acetate/3-ketoacid CoA transferase alpha subunit
VREKIASFEKAVNVIKDGNLLSMTTSAMDDPPMALLREVVRRGIKELKMAALPGGGLNVHFLIGAGVVKEYETCDCFPW